MLVLRSLAFNTAFYANLVVWLVICLPTMLLPRRALMAVARGWARSSLWLLRIIAGTRLEVRGLANIPQGGCLVACKHQSMWETFALVPFFSDPTFILKRELMFIPFFGWYLWKADMVPVNRRGGARAMVRMTEKAAEEARDGRQIIIFPEGTRRPPGAEPAYKYGIAHLYGRLGVPCLPVALNSGLYWPRRRFIRRPGTIVVEFLPPIPAGLPRDSLVPALVEAIEPVARRLHADGLAEIGGSVQPAPERAKAP